MFNFKIVLEKPGIFYMKYEDFIFSQNVCVRPIYMSICHADQRYYRGLRNIKILEKKLPMALIHECAGEVYLDSTNNFKIGEKVVLIPNVLSKNFLPGIFENYQKGNKFRSSGIDGFMQEFISIPPDRLVSVENIQMPVASISELLSVCLHAFKRMIKSAHRYRDKIGIWGDGSVGYLLALVINKMIPSAQIYVIGKHESKLSFFTFVNKTYVLDDIPYDFYVDHAFECAGGSGSYDAINSIIKHILPQGIIILMGVSEEKILINTRDILEKGLTFIGSSRSGYEDFSDVVKILLDKNIQNRISNIIYESYPAKDILSIHEAFKNDLETPFKTVFKWDF